MILSEIETLLNKYDEVFHFHAQVNKGTKEDKEDFEQNLKLYFIESLLKSSAKEVNATYALSIIRRGANKWRVKSQQKFEKTLVLINSVISEHNSLIMDEFQSDGILYDKFTLAYPKFTNKEKIVVSAIEQEIDQDKDKYFFTDICKNLGITKYALAYHVRNLRKKIKNQKIE